MSASHTVHADAATIESPEDVARKARTSNMLTPRFYTTDFAAMDRIDVAPIRAEWDKMMAEYEGDNNHDHFQRCLLYTSPSPRD